MCALAGVTMIIVRLSGGLGNQLFYNSSCEIKYER